MENQLIEYKESWQDEYLGWICGYANANGGVLYIGKSDNGSIVGFKNIKKLLEDIPNKIKNTLGLVCDVNFKTENDLEYLEIITPKMNQVITYRGKVHYRSGSTKQILDGPSLADFILKKTSVSWDSIEIGGLSVDDFDTDSFRLFKEIGILNKRLLPKDEELTKQELLEKLNLIKNGKITNAGMLLFYQNPEKYVHGSYVKIGFFESNSELIFHDLVKGSLVQQAEKVLDLIYLKYLKGLVSYNEGIYRVENYPYPKDVIREAIYNSIIHKRYQTGIPIQIKVFPDKLVIFNEAMFPEEWTKEDLFKLHKSKPINPLIADGYYWMGLVETWGRGIEKMVSGMEKEGLQPPNITVKKTDFTIEFIADKKSVIKIGNKKTEHNNTTVADSLRGLTVEEMEIIRYINENGQATRKEIEGFLNITKNPAIRILNKMIDKNILKKEGSSRKFIYFLK